MPFETDQDIVAEYLLRFADPAHARVLDIGCATGRLMRRYARAARSVVGIDPGGEMLTAALRACRPGARQPPRGRGERGGGEGRRADITVAQARAEALPFRDETFDAVILAWSL